jgi:mRNA-degrading endonuclease toxin of MazEF toxin-antitoxin module
VADYRAGQIVIADWRGALPREANKLRPAVVIQDDALFDPTYPNIILVPLTEDSGLAIPDLAVMIEPTPENWCAQRCYAVAPFVTATSAARLRPTQSAVTPEQLARIRQQVAYAIGIG